MPPRTKRYDRRYFDKWYRDPRHRISSPAGLRRKVQLIVSLTEFVLERPIRTVLDVGCGEAPWQRVLAKLRPTAVYTGIDRSPYVVQRYGRRRNIRLGSFEQLETCGLDRPFDLVVCSDVLHYLSRPQLVRGLDTVVKLVGGVACLEAYTSADDIEGDRHGFHHRSASAYRRIFYDAGLVPCGMQCYVRQDRAQEMVTLETLPDHQRGRGR
ncbi:MAG: class I SAM-dependent methyltransferase [Gemmatimonadales bacterium]|nr:MAG: class I SAM-dependent methyltransferase [Gemmatimonadales bacterium]